MIFQANLLLSSFGCPVNSSGGVGNFGDYEMLLAGLSLFADLFLTSSVHLNY